jgi:hypothetical protein
MIRGIVLGFGDIGVTMAFLVMVGSTVLCVVYGILHWNDEERPR